MRCRFGSVPPKSRTAPSLAIGRATFSAALHNSHIATLVERQTRFTKLVKVAGKDAASVATALSKQVRTLPRELRRTLTWDRGPEMAQHKKFSFATKVDVYFCDPSSPWQRGTNENTIVF